MARRKKKENKLLSAIIIIIIAIAYIYYNNGETSNSIEENTTKDSQTTEVSSDLTIYYLDVGQADSILITNQGYNMLIDAGNNEDGSKLVTYLKDELNITKLDYVVGTHPHEDHIGGLDNIIDNFDIDTIYLPDVTTTTKTFEDVITSIENKNLSITIPKINDTFKLGEAEFKVIYTGTDEEDLNNTSIVLKMTFGNYSYLFTGDATSETESEILNSDIDVDVLKVGHHGSAYSTTKEFLAKVTPTYAIISVGENNSYGHPSNDTLSRIKKYTNNIYMTSELGTIKLTSDGKEINITSIKTDTNG